MEAFAVPTSVLSTIDYVHHKLRRGYLSPYFSKSSITGLELAVRERISALCARLEDAMQKHQKIELNRAFLAMTGDTISQRLYGKHLDYLSIPNFQFKMGKAVLTL